MIDINLFKPIEGITLEETQFPATALSVSGSKGLVSACFSSRQAGKAPLLHCKYKYIFINGAKKIVLWFL